MQLDIRLPIGLMFAALGLILTIYGFATGSNTELYKRSLDININLWCGLLFLAFGGVFLLLAGKKRPGAP